MSIGVKSFSPLDITIIDTEMSPCPSSFWLQVHRAAGNY